MPWDIVVIGAGAAGLLAAARAAECGVRTLLLEKNRKPGVKILMSGGTRCNLTHDTDRRGIVEAFREQGRFLHSALAALGPRELVQLIEAEGVATKREETGKIFPVSNKANDVLQALLRRLERSGAELALDDGLKQIESTANGFRLTTTKGEIFASRVIVTTGGQSYPGCGTKGEGYHWARAFGHKIVTPRPALTPITTAADWVAELRGITIEDVGIKLLGRGNTVDAGKTDATKHTHKPLDQRRGSFLFTHFGLSGPAPLDISRTISAHPNPSSLDAVCDFLPAMNNEQLDASLHRECSTAGKRQLGNLLGTWLPNRLAEAFVALAGKSPDMRAAELSKRDRQALVALMKGAPIPVTGTRGFEKAEVTAGGVSLREVQSGTLESKLVPGLYFAGEVLDLDGPIGGYNFQAAFSTGWLAGQSAATELRRQG
jgi:predicted Rossmann fold flavoprotein